MRRIHLLLSVAVVFAAAMPASAVRNVPSQDPTIAQALTNATAGEEIIVDASTYPTENATLGITKDIVITSQNGSVTITGSGILANGVNIVGGANWTFNNVTVSGAEGHGMQVDVGGTLTLNNCAINGNGTAGVGAGAGINIGDISGSTLDIVAAGTTMDGNSQRGLTFDAAASATQTLNLDFTDVSLSNNQEGFIFGDPSGGLHDASALFTNVTIDGNSGAGIANFSGDIDWTGGACTTNGANGIIVAGGFQTPRVISLENVNVNGNVGLGVDAPSEGVYSFTGCQFNGNARGMIIGADGSSTITVTNCEFSNNAAVGLQPDGPNTSAIAQMDIVGTTISGNGESGLGLFKQGTYNIADCTITGNTFQGIARFFNGRTDGGIGTTLTIENTTISNNGAAGMRVDVGGDVGGTPVDSDVDMFLTDVIFDQNNQTSDQANLEVLGDGQKDIVASRCLFTMGPEADLANVFLVGASNSIFTNCIIDNVPENPNDAANIGLHMISDAGQGDEHGTGPEVEFNFCTLAGGADSTTGVLLEVTSGDNNPAVTLNNSIVSGYLTGVDFTITGTGFGVPSKSGDYSLYNNATNFAGGGALNTNDTTGDPLFTDPATGNFALQTGSPAIDSANPAATLSEDFNQDPRPNGSGHDRGALEFDQGLSVSGWRYY